MTEIKLVAGLNVIDGVHYEFGAVVDVPAEQAKRLLSLGVAVDPKAKVQAPAVEGAPGDVDLSSLKVDELRSLADQRGVDLPSDAKKADIIDLLEGE